MFFCDASGALAPIVNCGVEAIAIVAVGIHVDLGVTVAHVVVADTTFMERDREMRKREDTYRER